MAVAGTVECFTVLREICEVRCVTGDWNDWEGQFRAVDVSYGDAGSIEKRGPVRAKAACVGRSGKNKSSDVIDLSSFPSVTISLEEKLTMDTCCPLLMYIRI